MVSDGYEADGQEKRSSCNHAKVSAMVSICPDAVQHKLASCEQSLVVQYGVLSVYCPLCGVGPAVMAPTPRYCTVP